MYNECRDGKSKVFQQVRKDCEELVETANR